VAITGSSEKVVTLTSVRRDELLALQWAPPAFPSQATDPTFLGSIKSHRKKGLGMVFSSQNPSPQKRKGQEESALLDKCRLNAAARYLSGEYRECIRSVKE